MSDDQFYQEILKDAEEGVPKIVTPDPDDFNNRIYAKQRRNRLADCINDYFNEELELPKADIITSTNVFQHTPGVEKFLAAVRKHLADTGVWILEFPYTLRTFETLQFDQFYHEHFYYWLVTPLVKLFAKRYPIIGAVDKALKRSGFKVMLLLRLCSIIPFSALNYIGGVTGVQLSSFVNSMVGIIPSQLLTVLFGATAGSLKNSSIAEDWTLSNIVWLSVTGACGLLAIIVTIYFARKEIKKEIAREDTESLNPDSVMSSSGMASQSGDEFEINGTAADRERKSEEWWWVWA